MIDMKAKAKNVPREKKGSTKTRPVNLTGQILELIGIEIRNKRWEKKMSLQDVSQKAGITYLTISKLEKNELQNVSLSTLVQICDAVDMKLIIDFEPITSGKKVN
jgi:DNA-binding Xre family transcriptional regulator